MDVTSEFTKGNIRTFYVDELHIIGSATSKGNQTKWVDFDNNLFIKSQFNYQDTLWDDYKVEIIASNICKQLGIYAVEQNECNIFTNGKIIKGVYMNLFNTDGSEFIPYLRMCESADIYISQVNFLRKSVKDRIKYVKDTMFQITKFDYSDYIDNMILIDFIVGNEDRHLNNFGVLKYKDGSFSIAPLFDFGLGLFQHDSKYKYMDYHKAVRSMYGKPFSRTLYDALKCIELKNQVKEIYLPRFIFSDAKPNTYLRKSLEQVGVELNFE